MPSVTRGTNNHNGPEDPGNESGRVADDGWPSQQERPDTPVLIEVRGPFEHASLDRKPAPVPKVDQVAAKDSVDNGPEDVAGGGHGDQEIAVIRPAYVKAYKQELRLRWQHSRGEQGREKEACKCPNICHDGVSIHPTWVTAAPP